MTEKEIDDSLGLAELLPVGLRKDERNILIWRLEKTYILGYLKKVRVINGCVQAKILQSDTALQRIVKN